METRFKGTNFVGTLAAFEREQGEEARAELVAGLGGELGDALRTGALVTSGWYPASWYAELWRAIEGRIGGGTETARRLSSEAVKHDLKTLFRVMKLVLSPKRALTQSVRMARRYVEGGELELLEVRDDLMHYRLTGYHGYTALMWWDFIGGVEGTLESIGAREVESERVSGGGDGDTGIEFIVRWTQ